MKLNLLAGLALAASVVALGGCATPANVQNMAVSGVDARVINSASPLRDSVAVDKVIGGEETNPLWTSEISSEGFRQALTESLRNAGLLAALQGASKYALEVQLKNVQQPLVGLDMTVVATVNYVLKERDTGVVVWEGDIVSPYTATFSQAFAGFERLRLANEGSAKENIKQLIERLYSLDIKSAAVVK